MNNQSYIRKVNKNEIPTCNILGVNIAAINMGWLLDFLDHHLQEIKGDYICVSNVHTTVTSYRDPEYKDVQNGGLMAIPDGGPLSSVARRRGYRNTKRTTGPSLMGEIFSRSLEKGYRHFFYGSTEDTLSLLKKNLLDKYHGINIVGMYSPPFRPLSNEEDQQIIKMINDAKPDFVWVGLGAPKQEWWMAEHQGKIDGLMIGVGAGFNYYAGNLKRAPQWMQNANLEWLYRLMQDPKRLFSRYLSTNLSFIFNSYILDRHDYDVIPAHDKQRVLIVHNYYQIPGGEDTVVANEVKLLKEHGHEVFLYTRNNSELRSMGKLKIAQNTIFNNSVYKEIKNIIKDKGIDIVHVHNTLNVISPSVYYAALDCHVPVIQTIHNFRLLCPSAVFYRDGHICEDCVNMGLNCAVKHSCYRGNKIQTLGLVTSLRFHRARHIYGKINYICLTEFNKNKLLNLKQIKPEQIFIKPNFTGSDGIEISTTVKNQFIFAGRLDKTKGIILLLEAWKQFEMDNAQDSLIICGIGPEEQWCKNYIENNNLKRVKMLGSVTNHQVKQIMADSKALVLPTQLYEGFPMTIVEALSVGCPVLCSDLGNAGNIVEEKVTGYKFSAESAPDIVRTLELANSNPLDRNRIFSIYRNRYCADVNYSLLFDIYNQLCPLNKESY